MLARINIILAISLTCLLGACIKKKSSETAAADSVKIFYHLREAEEKSLDPMKQFDEVSHQLVSNLYDSLLSYHYLKRPYELVPNLLTHMPEKQADGRTYLFTLKKGVRFHDNACFPGGKGREMKADDVIYSFKRFADANVNRLTYILIQGLVVGMDEFRALSSKEGNKFSYDKHEISGVKKKDDYTFTITFVQDSPLNFHPLAFNGLAILPREAVEKYGDDLDKNPVGTGPFVMKTYSRRGTTILVRNPNYHGTYPTEGMPEDKAAGLLEAAGKKVPFVDEVHLPLIVETQPQMLKFKRGQLAYVGMNRDDFEVMVDRNGQDFVLKPEFAKDFDLYTVDGLRNQFIRIGLRDPVLSKKAVRQALVLALDTQGYINLMFNGRGSAPESLIPYDIQGSARETGSTWHKADIEAAKKKLAEAGYPNGKGLPTFVIEYRSTNKDQRQRFEYLRNEWAKIGVKVEANFQSFSNFLKKTDEGNYQLADAGWNADYPDAENFYSLLYGKNVAPGPNTGHFVNARYDELYLKSRHMKDGPERWKIFAEMDAILKDEVPLILLINNAVVGMKQKSVRNFKRNMMVPFPYKYYDLAP
ncbi:ABC transporter substrate-binding protein [Oligoflexus tunisiensis]|uniref:ABC transporter substrate-binding protein n=1 Tax=Oligoflexus tunisiensis TaxID=708132 RepID=UPI00159F0C18|nr:ABC transporter substrate-binding protein [Oligoflexus tunisiensis]